MAGQYVMKIYPEGGAVAFSTFLGSWRPHYATYDFTAVALAPDDTFYVAGYGELYSRHDPAPGGKPLLPCEGSCSTAFLLRMSRDGQRMFTSGCFGGSCSDEVLTMDVSPDGTVYVAGYTYSIDFPTVGGFQPTAKLEEDCAYCDTFKFVEDGFVVAVSERWATPTPAPTHVPELLAYVWTNERWYKTGYRFQLIMSFTNFYPLPLRTKVACVLSVFRTWYYWPSWTLEPEYRELTFPPGLTVLAPLSFIWPPVDEGMRNLLFILFVEGVPGSGVDMWVWSCRFGYGP
jgi:hypothetical protein